MLTIMNAMFHSLSDIRLTLRHRNALSIWVASAICAFLVPVAAAAGSPIRIELMPEIAVTRPQVMLGDIASLAADELPVLQQLMNLPLGQTPRAGTRIVIRREHLARWIRARTGIAASDVAWSGAESSTVHLALQTVSGDAVVNRVKESVKTMLAKYGLRADVNIARIPKDIEVPSGVLELEVRPVPSNAALARHVVVWIDVTVNGDIVRTMPVDVKLSVFGSALVAVRDMAPGELLNETDLIKRDVEWSGRTVRPADVDTLFLPSNHQKLRLRRAIAAGDAVVRGQTEQVPLVTSGNWATLRTVRGMIALESRVEVLQDGASGQSVRVRLPNAASAIIAHVVGPGIVEVNQ